MEYLKLQVVSTTEEQIRFRISKQEDFVYSFFEKENEFRSKLGILFLSVARPDFSPSSKKFFLRGYIKCYDDYVMRVSKKDFYKIYRSVEELNNHIKKGL